MSGRSRYEQLALLLEGRIVGGSLAPGQQLASEAELGQEFGLSRVTVRKALAVLADAGLVRSRQGKGTFVVDPLPAHLGRVRGRALGPTYLGFIDDLLVEGTLTATTVLDRTEVKPDRVMAERLGLRPGQRPVRFRWVRTVGGRPVAFGLDHLTPRAGARVSLEAARSAPSLVHAFDHAGLRPTENVQRLTAAPAPAPVGRRLDVAPGSALVRIDGVALDADGAVFDAYRLWLGPDYQLQLRFMRVGGQGATA